MQHDVLEITTAVGRADVENISPSNWFQSGLILDGRRVRGDVIADY